MVHFKLLPLLVTLVSAFRIFSHQLLVRSYIYTPVITSFLFSSFLVCDCAPCLIILDTLLLYFWCGDRLAGTTFISLKCGSTRFVKTLSMVVNHCPQLGAILVVLPTRERGWPRVLTCNLSHQCSHFLPPTQHLLLSLWWPRKNHGTTHSTSRLWARPLALVLAINPSGWILMVLSPPLPEMRKVLIQEG